MKLVCMFTATMMPNQINSPRPISSGVVRLNCAAMASAVGSVVKIACAAGLTSGMTMKASSKKSRKKARKKIARLMTIRNP